MKKKFGQNLSQIGALHGFYGHKNLGRQSSGIELSFFSLHGQVFPPADLSGTNVGVPWFSDVASEQDAKPEYVFYAIVVDLKQSWKKQ